MIQRQIGIDGEHGVSGRILERNGQFGGAVGQGGAVDGLVFKDIGGGLDARTSGGVDGKLPQRSGPCAIGKGQVDVASQYRAAEVDVEKPAFARIVRIGLPEGRRIAVYGAVGRSSAAAGSPYASGDFAALLGSVGEEMGVADGVDFLAVFDEVQCARVVYAHQAVRDGPTLPGCGAVEDQGLRRAGQGEQ